MTLWSKVVGIGDLQLFVDKKNSRLPNHLLKQVFNRNETLKKHCPVPILWFELWNFELRKDPLWTFTPSKKNGKQKDAKSILAKIVPLPFLSTCLFPHPTPKKMPRCQRISPKNSRPYGLPDVDHLVHHSRISALPPGENAVGWSGAFLGVGSESYCWWLKSCKLTSWGKDSWNPIIYRVNYISQVVGNGISAINSMVSPLVGSFQRIFL